MSIQGRLEHRAALTIPQLRAMLYAQRRGYIYAYGNRSRTCSVLVSRGYFTANIAQCRLTPLGEAAINRAKSLALDAVLA